MLDSVNAYSINVGQCSDIQPAKKSTFWISGNAITMTQRSYPKRNPEMALRAEMTHCIHGFSLVSISKEFSVSSWSSRTDFIVVVRVEVLELSDLRPMTDFWSVSYLLFTSSSTSLLQSELKTSGFGPNADRREESSSMSCRWFSLVVDPIVVKIS